MSTHRVEYIGAKPVKVDNVAGTGTTWVGQGDVQAVTEAAWAKLSMHPTVWRLEQTEAKAEKPAAATKPAGPQPDPLAQTTAPAADGAVTIAGTVHQLADIDAAAHKESGLSAEDWAGLSDADRADFRQAQIATMQLLAEKQANAALKAKPAAKKAPAKKTGKK